MSIVLYFHSGTIQTFLPAHLAVVPSSPAEHPQTNGLPTEFISSISRDVEGVRGVADGLDYVAVKEFLSALDRCNGQILLSGMGEECFQPNLYTIAFASSTSTSRKEAEPESSQNAYIPVLLYLVLWCSLWCLTTSWGQSVSIIMVLCNFKGLTCVHHK